MRKAALWTMLAALALGLSRTPILRALRSAPATEQAKAIPPEARVDINRASVDELLKTPGMTRTWAERIVRFRPYRTKLDLLEHGVVPSQVYDRIKGYIIAHREKQ